MSIVLYESIHSKDRLYIFLLLRVLLSFAICSYKIDLVFVVQLIFDDMLYVEFSCLYHIWRRTVRYIYKTIGMVEKIETILA